MLERIANRQDYDRLRSHFPWDCPAHFNFAADVVDHHAAERPEAAALYWVEPGGERVLSFRELAQRSQQVAAALLRLGLQRGDRVLVVLPRVPAWWEALVGILRAGLVAVPGTTLLTGRDLGYRIGAAGATAILTDAAGAEKLDNAPEVPPQLRARILVDEASRPGWERFEEIVRQAPTDAVLAPTASNDPALLYFTSGTTGLPKMVLHTQASYGLGHQITGRLWLDLEPGDLHWNLSDTGWAKAAWSSLFGPWSVGATVFAQHSSGPFRPADVLQTLARYPITSLCAPPTVYRMLVQEDLSTLRAPQLRSCVAAGEPLNPEAIAVWQRATGLTIRDGYGQTETVMICGNFPGVPIKPGSMGLPSPGIELAIVDAAGVRLPAGEEGDIAVRVEPFRPLPLFQEYFRDAQATAAAHRQGWYITGDRGRRDEDGYFWFVGRADDVITSSAYRIGPFEIESVLIEHPAVVEAAVVGKPDPLRTEVVKAFVVLAPGYVGSETLCRELQEFVKNRTAPYKYPREIEFLEELPKTVSGKIRRLELRQRERMGHG
jgi:acetyl-CoA synthetase/medium-chain acyl-CoA synthetase